MALSFSCDCGQEMQAKEEHAGRRTRCPKCGKDVMIPSVEPAPPPGEPLRPEAVAERRRPDAGRYEDDDEPRQRRRPQSSGMGAGWIIILVLRFAFLSRRSVRIFVLIIFSSICFCRRCSALLTPGLYTRPLNSLSRGRGASNQFLLGRSVRSQSCGSRWCKRTWLPKYAAE